MLPAKWCSVPKIWIGIQDGDEGLAVTDLKSDPLRVFRGSTLNVGDGIGHSRPAKEIQDIASVTAGFVLLATWFWLLRLLRSCRILRKSFQRES